MSHKNYKHLKNFDNYWLNKFDLNHNLTNNYTQSNND